jgi:hypothetical protein
MIWANCRRLQRHRRVASRDAGRGTVGTWHRVNAKHLQAYLNEMCWRFDNRNNPYLFRDTLLKMLDVEHVEYTKLTAEAA